MQLDLPKYLPKNLKSLNIHCDIFQIVVGKIYHVVDDDLYLDFGGKFHCVCTRPRGPSGRAYQRGVEVRLRIKKLESSQKFLGYEKEMSLLEAECILLGLHK